MFKIDGLDQVITNLRRFINDLQSNLATDLGAVSGSALAELRVRTSQEFQTVPTYLYESNVLKLPGYKQFDTDIGFFSREAAPVEGTAWEGMVQLHLNGPHLLNELLTQEVITTHGDNIEASVGYPDGTGTRQDTKYIVQTLFGTVKEQGRNFLAVILRDYEEIFWRAAHAAGLRALDNGR